MNEILSLLDQRRSYQWIADYLGEHHDFSVSAVTLRRACRTWGIRRRRENIDSPRLRARIAILFYEWCLTDKKILTVLRKEGFDISHRVLQDIRRKMGLYQRVSPLNREEADRKLLECVQKELDKGLAEGFGRTNLYSYFRSNMYMVSRYAHIEKTANFKQSADSKLEIASSPPFAF